MNKGTLLRKLNEKLDKITNAVYEFRDLLDDTEDEDLSQFGNDFADALVNFISDNDITTSSDIIIYIEENYGKKQ